MNNDDWFLEKIDNRTIKTIFGTAKIQKDGYYHITSRREGNNKKFLHILVWERKNGKKPNNFVIHHRDFNKKNNRINNLMLLSDHEHRSLHTSGEQNPQYGKPNPIRSKLNKQQIGDKNPFYGKEHSNESLLQMSSQKNNTGIFRVSKRICKKCNRGFIYGYRWKKNGKMRQISSTYLYDLKNKILSNNEKWIIIDENKFNLLKEEEVLIDDRATKL